MYNKHNTSSNELLNSTSNFSNYYIYQMIGAFVVVNLHKNGHTSLKQMLLPKRWPLIKDSLSGN